MIKDLFTGPRNYGKSIEWKLEGDPWVSEGLYSDNTRGIYLLCLILQVRKLKKSFPWGFIYTSLFRLLLPWVGG